MNFIAVFCEGSFCVSLGSIFSRLSKYSRKKEEEILQGVNLLWIHSITKHSNHSSHGPSFGSGITFLF